MASRDRLIKILADGEVHSGSELASLLGVTRSAVWKQVHQLENLGIEVVAEAGRGYRFASPLDLLDHGAILGAIDEATRAACEHLQVSTVSQSTSLALSAQPAPTPGRWRAILAEYQTAGRGRRGRAWLSPFGSGVCLSVSWCFPSVPRDLPALSLAAGIAARRALAAAGATDASLKWPNDIVADGAKLAGILVDVDGDGSGPLRAVVGIGVNVSAPERFVRAVTADGGLAPGALERACPAGSRIGRNALAAALLDSLYGVLREFPSRGFGPLADEWRCHDYLRGRPITVSGGPQVVSGVARGIGPDGALLVEGPAGLSAVTNGDITLRVPT
jgi:BirA family biotin operon repressor/biotin-[acetyl-CoA-carboxylase] ligase